VDIAVTAILWCFCAGVLFRIGKRFGAQNPTFGRGLLIISIALATALAWQSSGSLLWAHWIPQSYVVIVCNASVILIVAAAGLLVGTHCLSLRRERLAVFALCATAVWFVSAAAVRPILEPLRLEQRNQWVESVCLQSHDASCAPAAAATLLGLHGIAQTEHQMANACLTSRSGTLSLGLYRGLCIGARNSAFKPRVLVCAPNECPQSDLEHRLPLLANVEFQSGEGAHSVVLMKKLDDGDWLVADPAVGVQRWSDSFFRNCWKGEGIFLAARNLRSF